MKTALSTLYVYVFMLLLMSGYSQMFTLDIWPSVSAITFSISFFPFSWLLKLLLNKAACPCTTQDEEDMFGDYCGIPRSEQDTPGCYCEIKGKNPSRRQNTRALFIELPFSLREPPLELNAIKGPTSQVLVWEIWCFTRVCGKHSGVNTVKDKVKYFGGEERSG